MFTENQFVQEVVKIVNENPDFVYKNKDGKVNNECSYLKCNNACLFGVVLSNLGMSQEDLSKYEGYNIIRILHKTFGKFGFDKDVVCWAEEIQSKQDKGLPWKECLEAGNKEYPGVVGQFA